VLCFGEKPADYNAQGIEMNQSQKVEMFKSYVVGKIGVGDEKHLVTG